MKSQLRICTRLLKDNQLFSNVERIGSIFFKHGKLGMQQNLFVFFFAQEREQEHEKGKKSFRFFYNYDAFVIWVFLLWLVEKVAKQFVWKSCHLQEKQERSNRDFSVFCQGKCGPTHLLSHEKNLSSKIVSLTVYLGCKTRVTHCYTYRSLT